ncbi:MAG: hypothetical protein R3C26_13475 [Calditrichia bacterium]
MPDFRLTDAEAETIAAYLLTVKSSRRLPEILLKSRRFRDFR